MIRKLAISMEEDNKAADIIINWSQNSSAPNDIEWLVSWYKSEGLSDNPPGSIFRGIHFMELDFDKALNKGIPLINNKFDSWTVDVGVAYDFSWTEGREHGVGIVLSKKLKSGDNFVDINNSINWISRGLGESDKGIKRLKNMSMFYECEIITIPSCINCDLVKDVECLMVNKDIKGLVDVVGSSGWSFNNEIKSNGHYGYYCVFNKNKTVDVYYSWKDVFSKFKIKPDTKCS